jgi:predicted ArsR family transcriptional regulator
VDDPLAVVAALGDRRRRAVYRFVALAHRSVTRDEAAEAVGVARATAAFHLDRLVADGLLDAEFRRLGGRQGPGAGRPTKLYRRSADDIALSLPPRHYELAADLLASAVEEAAGTGEPVADALARVARQRGVSLAAGAGVGEGSVDAAAAVLAAAGYEPVVDGGEVALANCPFHALATDHRDLVCGMNLALLDGFAGALPGPPLRARLQPDDHHCCVRLGPGPTTRRRRP